MKIENDELIVGPILFGLIRDIKVFNPDITRDGINKALGDFRKAIRGKLFKQESKVPLEKIEQWVAKAKQEIAQIVEKKVSALRDDEQREMTRGELTNQLIKALQREICKNCAERIKNAIKGLLAAGAGTALLLAAFKLLKDGQDPKEAVERAREESESREK